MVMWVSVAAWITTNINTLSYSRTPLNCNLLRRGKYGHRRNWRGDACRSMVSVSMSSNGNMCKSWSNWRRDIEDKSTWRKKPRSANNPVIRQLRQVNAERTSAQDRYEKISIRTKSAISSNVVIISISWHWAARVSVSVIYVVHRDGNSVSVYFFFLSSPDLSQRTNVIVRWFCSLLWQKWQIRQEKRDRSRDLR